MSDGDEDAGAGDLAGLVAVHVAQAHAGDAGGLAAAEDLVDAVVPDHLDLGMLEQPVLQDALGAQLVAAMDQRDLGGEVRQEQRLLDGGVAASDHHDLLAAIEEPVAGGAGRDAESLEALLGRQAQPAGLGAGGEDDGVGEIGRPALALGPEGQDREVEAVDVVGDQLGAGGAGVLLHPGHERGALDLDVAGPVLHLGGDGELAAGLDALHEDRREHGARAIDRGGVARRAGADDEQAGMACGGFGQGLGHGAFLRPRHIGAPRPAVKRGGVRPALRAAWRIPPPRSCPRP